MSFLNKSQILLFRKQSTLQPTAVAQAAHMKEKNKITLPNEQQQEKKKRKKENLQERYQKLEIKMKEK